MAEIFNIENESVPLEIMANLHRINNSNSLARDRDSHWGRTALVIAFNKAIFFLQRLADYAVIGVFKYQDLILFPRESK